MNPAAWGELVMSRFCLLAIVVITAALPASAQETPAGAKASAPDVKAGLDPDLLARRLWAVTETVLEHDVEPPTRQEMFLGAVRSLVKAVGMPQPADLSRRLSNVTTVEQLAEFFRALQTAKINAA